MKLKNVKFNFETETFAWNDKLSFFDTAPILLGLTCYRCLLHNNCNISSSSNNNNYNNCIKIKWEFFFRFWINSLSNIKGQFRQTLCTNRTYVGIRRKNLSFIFTLKCMQPALLRIVNWFMLNGCQQRHQARVNFSKNAFQFLRPQNSPLIDYEIGPTCRLYIHQQFMSSFFMGKCGTQLIFIDSLHLYFLAKWNWRTRSSLKVGEIDVRCKNIFYYNPPTILILQL